MDPHRPWATQSGNAQQPAPEQFRPTQQSPPSNHSNLPPPPPGPFPSFHSQPPQSLPNLPSISQSSPRQGVPPPPSSRDGPPPPPPSQGPQLPLPGFSQATGQPGAAERERERAREAEQIHIKEEEDRRHREQQERQRLEQAPPHHQTQPGPPMPLHQPVAVGPQRTVHGPNGLLSNPGQPQPQMPLGAPSGPGNVFAGGPVQATSQAPGPAQQQQMQPGMLMPFAPGQQPAQQQQQQQMNQPQQQQQQQGQGQGQQPILNDALSYLDQVKVQFADHPDVYNRFLDIMKDFKSGAIDTPGVIGRVSTLFAGNPDLIQGFNTFLPPGYRIECGADNDPNTIRVTTPMGTTVSSMPQPQTMAGRLGDEPEAGRPANGTFTPQPGQQTAQMIFSPSGRPVGPAAPAGGQQPQQHLDAVRQQEQQAMQEQQQRGVSSLQNAVSAAATGALRPGVSPRATPLPGQQDPNAQVGDGQQGPAGMEKRGPVEFNHAISYVNKIKNRFASHPDIYKQFLEILQTYQRESKPIQDVYSQVTHLFKTAPDLLEDFKQFLPESAAQAKAAERARQQAEESAMLSNVRGEAGPMYGSPVMSRETHIGTPSHGRGNLPPVGNFAPTPISKDNKRKRNDRQGTAGSVIDGTTGTSANKGAIPFSTQQGKRLKQTHPPAAKGAGDQPPASPTLIPRLPEPLPPTTTSAATHEELSFFDRAKKAIGNKNTMNEFLKLCNLFSMDFIDRTTLVYRARAFIGNNPDLMKWFTDFVGYDEKDIVIENRAREPVVPGGRVSLSNCRGLGPSYRLLPKRERQKTCSGRDELCNSVLNDEWASHPTWASEDSGFIAHRKNVHEEGLHRIEEERHDYDYNIEACSRTIQLLEPFAQQLRRMSTVEEQVQFRLPPGLGGQSETIYRRVIMKLYGREKGQDVVTQLHQAPYQVIPVLLNRLKERLETWKMAQREWEKVWREQTQKMFWKSLDHQAVNARTSDRRQFQTKTLVAEVSVRFEEMKKDVRNNFAAAGRPQLEVKVEDLEVVVDAAWLTIVHIEAGGQGGAESPRLVPFIREFVPLFFGIEADVFEKKLKERMGGTPARDPDDPMSGAEDSGGEKRGRKNGKTTLLRQTLDKGTKGRLGRKERDDSASRATTPDVTSNAGDEGPAVDGMAVDVPGTGTVTPAGEESTSAQAKLPDTASRWFEHPTDGNEIGTRKVDPSEPQLRTIYRLWANQPIFCFVRMFLILYERLHKLKMSEAECKEIVRHANKHKPAIELGIVDKTPSDFFADTSPSANFYAQMLQKFAEVLQGELDFVNDGVEECLRRFYLQAGYPLYAFEKMVQALARYGGQVVSQEATGGNKEKSWDVFNLWKKDRLKGEMVSAVNVTDYRKQAEKLIATNSVASEGYAVDWDEKNKAVRIYLVKKDDPYATADGLSELDRENRWRHYVAGFSAVEATDGVNQKKLEPVMLTRNMRDVGADPNSDVFPAAVANVSLADREQADGQDASQTPAAGEAATGEDDKPIAQRILARFTAAKSDEQLVLRVALNNYHIRFEPGTHEGFVEPMKYREEGKTGVEEAQAAKAERDGAMKVKFVVHSEGMAGLSEEEVEKDKAAFAELSGEPSDVVKGEGMEVDA